MTINVFYHANCADGFGAAWAAKQYFDKTDYTVTYTPIQYGKVTETVAHLIASERVIFVDFCPLPEDVIALLKRGCSVEILDHHQSAIDRFKEAALDDAALATEFDTTRSGALITWQHFLPYEPVPKMIELISDRDLWKFENPYSKDFSMYLFSYPYDFTIWNNIAYDCETDDTFQPMICAGEALQRKLMKDIAELAVDGTSWIDGIAAGPIPIMNVPYTMASEAGHYLCKQHNALAAAAYWDTKTHRVFSLRSLDDGVDVQAIARKFGGGGHVHAAGFQLKHGTYSFMHHSSKALVVSLPKGDLIGDVALCLAIDHAAT